MTVLINDTFAANVSAWTVSAGTLSHVASEGSDFDSGYASAAAGTTAYRTFTAVSSGKIKVEWWWKDAGVSIAANTNILFYLLPDSTITSSNSAATISLNRVGATSTEYFFSYRDSAGFQNSIYQQRDAWCKSAVIVDLASRTYDFYINDVLYVRGVASANTTYTSIDRIAFISQSAANDTYFDNIVVESAWALSESVLIDQDFVGGSGEIEDNTPTTDIRNASPQKWMIPYTTTGYGSFTLGANGGTQDASKAIVALARCTADGIAECEWKSSVAGTIYFGIIFRFWDYPTATGAGAGIARIYGGATNTIILQLPDRAGVNTTVASVAFTPAANTIYTLKVEMRGRYIIVSYKAAAMGAGSYTVAITHAVTSSATGGRGMLSEEYCGPWSNTTLSATDNYLRRFRFTGAVSDVQHNVTIGEYDYAVDAGSIRQIANASSGGGSQSFTHSKGIQFSHRSSADGQRACRDRTLINGTHCKSYEQRAANMTEYQSIGDCRPFITLLRRGPWIADNIRVFDKTLYAENYAPDLDFNSRYMATPYRYIQATGTSTAGTNTTAHDWIADASAQTLPVGHQKATDFPSGDEIRITQVIDSASTNTDSLAGDITSKWEQTGDPVSHAWSPTPASLTNATEYTVCRSILLQRGSGLTTDATTLEQLRDDVKTPATLIMTVGTAKTNAAGDYNTDGFNERHGWYELTCASGEFSLTLPVPGSGKRFQPAFRLWSYSLSGPTVTIAGTPGVSGTDYVIDDVGDGTAILQILSDRTADTTIALAAGAGGSSTYKNLMLLGVG